jgi:hypothetical protein
LDESLGGLGVVRIDVWVGTSGKRVELSGEKISELTAVKRGKEKEHVLFEFYRRAIWLELENFIVVYCRIIEKEARGREG